ncbi:DUF1656 domain-containing protein [Pseudomonas sp. R3.Fl]|uniref:DUF1656 domain-containing protein n=1 Tax=Pseudomonas sp. R3.Fl TaxID=2928708 RepID=UPI00201DBF50|nr:DUF1656 domain-containing protein [Pseudomonas sp. R3.Fl]MCL6692473.1 DUF1656 domain-containing protein [Pseudomonas sp. R3.Fl]
MIGEIDLYGVFLPSLLLMLLLAFVITRVLRALLMYLGLYRYVWHHFLFNFALYVIVLGSSVTLTHGWHL